jgi:thiosulfate dehydrogenase [quinone] large subunit
MIQKLLKVERSEIRNPDFVQKLCASPRLAWVWLPLRLYLGWVWLNAGWAHMADEAWMVTGEALKSFWDSAVQVSADRVSPDISVDWYLDFIQFLLDGGHYAWLGRLLVFAQVLIGMLLILGALTGIVAALAAFMSWNLIMAGAAGANGLLLILALMLVLGWQIAGYVGLDYWLLALLNPLRTPILQPDEPL